MTHSSVVAQGVSLLRQAPTMMLVAVVAPAIPRVSAPARTRADGLRAQPLPTGRIDVPLRSLASDPATPDPDNCRQSWHVDGAIRPVIPAVAAPKRDRRAGVREWNRSWRPACLITALSWRWTSRVPPAVPIRSRPNCAARPTNCSRWRCAGRASAELPRPVRRPGRGVLALIRPVDRAPKAILLNRAIPALSRLWPTTTPPAARRPQRLLRVRAVVHAGEVNYDANGCFGEAWTSPSACSMPPGSSGRSGSRPIR